MNSNQSVNPFQQLAESHRPPPEIKKKVMSSAKFSYMVLYTVDLFVNKSIATVGALLGIHNHQK